MIPHSHDLMLFPFTDAVSQVNSCGTVEFIVVTILQANHYLAKIKSVKDISGNEPVDYKKLNAKLGLRLANFKPQNKTGVPEVGEIYIVKDSMDQVFKRGQIVDILGKGKRILFQIKPMSYLIFDILNYVLENRKRRLNGRA